MRFFRCSQPGFDRTSTGFTRPRSAGNGRSFTLDEKGQLAWQLRRQTISSYVQCSLAKERQASHLEGSQRNSMLRAFKTNPEVDVMLLSLRAGGEGLNLQCASHVMLLDPWVREGPHSPAAPPGCAGCCLRLARVRCLSAVESGG